MKVTVYDRNPGEGLGQWFLKASWAVGCWLQKLLGQVDDYYGAESWLDALKWLASHGETLESVQYWGHGSPGAVWLAGKSMSVNAVATLKPHLTVESLVWFRTCSTFQGPYGHEFSRKVADTLGCTVAGHTRIIGLFQGGLHTRRPQEAPEWPASEGELPPHWIPAPLRWWGSNTIICLRTRIPEGW